MKITRIDCHVQLNQGTLERFAEAARTLHRDGRGR